MTTTDPPPLDEFGLAGTVIAERFSVEAPIAEGGFGLVYRGTHLGFGRPVAIKCLRVPRELKGARRDAFLRQFEAEGRLLFELSNLHAGIVRAIETGTVRAAGEDVPYLVLEWLEGESLERVMEKRIDRGTPQLSLPEIVSSLEPVAQALAAAHERGVVHRDVKPSNIVFADVMGKRTAKILDFGIAKVMHDAWSVTSAKTSRVAGGVGMFTPAYAAPEQWVTRFGATGPWTDVFALALVCVEMLAGVPALEGPTIPNFMGQCIDDDVRPTPRTRGSEVPERVEAIFQKALAVEPAQRHRDVGVFWKELHEAARGMSTDATQRLSLDSITHDTTIYGAPLAAQGGGQADPSATSKVQPLRPISSKRPVAVRRIAMAGGLVALALGAVLVGRALQGDAHETMVANGSSELSGAVFVSPTSVPDAATLQDKSLPPGWLTVLCTPYCSDIEVDGRSLGPSPLLAAAVPAGRRDVAMKRDGTPTKRIKLLVHSGASRDIAVSMEP